jgi:DNA-binding LytR/AlgR family response regulator
MKCSMKSKGQVQKINPTAVVLMVANTNYTTVHFDNGKKLMVATTLKKFEERFSESTFLFRSHKSFMINLRHVESLVGNSIKMKNHFSVAVSRRKKESLKCNMLDFSQKI